MNKAIFYIKDEKTADIWAKLISKNNDVIFDVLLSNNEDYESFQYWKNHDFEFHDNCSEFTNELYHYYFMPIIYKFLRFQETHNIREIYFEGEHKDFYIAAGFFFKKNIRIKGLKFFKLKYYFLFVKKIVLYIKSQLISFGIIFYKAIFNTKFFYPKQDLSKDFALIHSKASLKNIEKLNLDLNYYYDDINLKLKINKNAISFYKILNVVDYLNLIFKSFILTHNLFKKLAHTGKAMVGDFGTIQALNFFSPRIGHYIIINNAYNKIFKHNSNIKFYSGERESRYGILAMNLAKKHKKIAIAIPHGMSYSYKYPLGIFGNKYYTTTKNELNYLSEIYSDIEFVFDNNLCKKIYESENQKNNIKKIVFFTEPRRPEVNLYIIENLLNKLDQNLYIKLHPHEKEVFYRKFKNIKFINDFNIAIQSNICISRKSTILVEALYNNSISIALLVDKKDGFDFNNSFPSLLSSEINQCHSFKDLVNKIKKYQNEI